MQSQRLSYMSDLYFVLATLFPTVFVGVRAGRLRCDFRQLLSRGGDRCDGRALHRRVVVCGRRCRPSAVHLRARRLLRSG